MSGLPSTSVTLAAAEPLLFVVVALLLLVIAGLIAMALFVRKRSRPHLQPAPEPVRATPVSDRPPPRPRPRPAMIRGGGGGGLAVATSTAMVCPTCRTEYHGMAYCTRDARRLVPPEEMLGGPLRAMSSGKSAG